MSGQKNILEARFCFALTDPESVLTVSDSVEMLLGYRPECFLGGEVNLKNLIHSDDQDIAGELFSRIADQPAGSFNIRLRQANGRIRCFKGSYSKSFDEGGQRVILELLLQDAKSIYRSLSHLPMMERLRAVLENTDDYIYFKDRNHVFTGASQTLVQITDPSSHWTDLLGQTDYDVFPEHYADIYYRLEKQVFSGVSVAHEIQETLTKDGQKGWVDNRKYPVRNTSGEIVGLFGIARDITETKRVEEALAESEQRFRSIFEQVPSISVQGYDRERRVIFWNRASEKLYGYSSEQALGRLLEELIIPEPMRAGVVEGISAWVAGGSPIPACELTLQGANGLPVDVFSSHVMLRNRNGEPEMYCIDIDISERKRMEDALRISEERHRLLADNATDVIWVMDFEGRLTYVSPSVEKLRGYTSEEVMRQSLDEIMVPTSAEIARDELSKAVVALNEGLPVPDFRGEFQQPCKDGSTIWTEVTTTGMRNAEGKYVGILGVSRDITEHKRMEDQVRQLAFHDALTGLPNRRLLGDRLSQVMAAGKRSGRYSALMFLDLDNFKQLNDTHGHEVGDLLLIETAERLKSCVRAMDTVARLGGDEFVVMVNELDVGKAESATQASLVAEKICDVLAEPYWLVIRDGLGKETVVEHCCTASVGLKVFIGNEISQEEILRLSDIAMYRAKEVGGNSVRFAPESEPTEGVGERVLGNPLQLVWNSSYECGNALIDDQHRMLFGAVNEILGAMLCGRPADEVAGLLSALIRNSAQHFHDEEVIFTKASFPGAIEHAAIHRQLVGRAEAMLWAYRAGTLAIGDLFKFLARDVVTQHMLGADREFFPYLQEFSI